MMEPVLDLITSYENRISTVEDLITNAYQATVTSQGSLGIGDGERERLVVSLQKMLAKNCSLRKRDFHFLMQRVLCDADRYRSEIEEERRRLGEKFNEYLDEQKALANMLREQLLRVTQDNSSKSELLVVLDSIKNSCHESGQRLLVMLRDYQVHLGAFQREQEEINNKLQRLLDRGESLQIEDLRQLEATRSREERVADRELRREEVERLLTNFRQQRQQNRRWQQQNIEKS